MYIELNICRVNRPYIVRFTWFCQSYPSSFHEFCESYPSGWHCILLHPCLLSFRTWCDFVMFVARYFEVPCTFLVCWPSAVWLTRLAPTLFRVHVASCLYTYRYIISIYIHIYAHVRNLTESADSMMDRHLLRLGESARRCRVLFPHMRLAMAWHAMETMAWCGTNSG